MWWQIGRRLFRIGLRLMGFDPVRFVGFTHPDFADQDVIARFANDAWWLESCPVGTTVMVPLENGSRAEDLIRERQRVARTGHLASQRGE